MRCTYKFPFSASIRRNYATNVMTLPAIHFSFSLNCKMKNTRCIFMMQYFDIEITLPLIQRIIKLSNHQHTKIKLKYLRLTPHHHLLLLPFLIVNKFNNSLYG